MIRPSSSSHMVNFHRLALKVREVCEHTGNIAIDIGNIGYSVTIVLACSERMWNVYARLLYGRNQMRVAVKSVCRGVTGNATPLCVGSLYR